MTLASLLRRLTSSNLGGQHRIYIEFSNNSSISWPRMALSNHFSRYAASPRHVELSLDCRAIVFNTGPILHTKEANKLIKDLMR